MSAPHTPPSLSATSTTLLLALLTLASMASEAIAQRGRGPSEFIKTRSGSHFTTTTLPAPDEDGKVDFAQSPHVTTASQDGALSLLYLYDPNKSDKHAAFEQTILGHAEVSLLLRGYQCARVDLADAGEEHARLRELSPSFVTCNAKGEIVGQVSFSDYRAQANPLIALLQKSARKHGKMPLKTFTKNYRKFLTEYQLYESRSKTLTERQNRLSSDHKDEAKRRKLDQESYELEQTRKGLLDTESKLLEKANIPSRIEGAVLLGQRPRRGR